MKLPLLLAYDWPALVMGGAFLVILVCIGTWHTVDAFRRGFGLRGLFLVITFAAISFAILFAMVKVIFRGHFL